MKEQLFSALLAGCLLWAASSVQAAEEAMDEGQDRERAAYPWHNPAVWEAMRSHVPDDLLRQIEEFQRSDVLLPVGSDERRQLEARVAHVLNGEAFPAGRCDVSELPDEDFPPEFRRFSTPQAIEAFKHRMRTGTWTGDDCKTVIQAGVYYVARPHALRKVVAAFNSGFQEPPRVAATATLPKVVPQETWGKMHLYDRDQRDDMWTQAQALWLLCDQDMQEKQVVDNTGVPDWGRVSKILFTVPPFSETERLRDEIRSSLTVHLYTSIVDETRIQNIAAGIAIDIVPVKGQQICGVWLTYSSH